MAADNKSLGKFMLDGIPPAPRGVPQIEVTFDIDANGILNVKAVDKGTNKEQHITITGSSGMSEEEVEKLKKEAEIHADEDKKKKDKVETRINAETLVSTCKRTLKDAGDKVDEDTKKPIQEKIEALEKLLADEGTDEAKIKEASDALSEEIQKVGAAMYQADPAQDAANAEKDDEDVKVYEKDEKEEDVVEGEVVEEEKKD